VISMRIRASASLESKRAQIGTRTSFVPKSVLKFQLLTTITSKSRYVPCLRRDDSHSRRSRRPLKLGMMTETIGEGLVVSMVAIAGSPIFASHEYTCLVNHVTLIAATLGTRPEMKKMSPIVTNVNDRVWASSSSVSDSTSLSPENHSSSSSFLSGKDSAAKAEHKLGLSSTRPLASRAVNLTKKRSRL